MERSEIEDILGGISPGKWSVRREVVAQVYRDSYGDGGYNAEACFVLPLRLQVYGPDWKQNRECSATGNPFICANARLIAAAPEIARNHLAALDEIDRLRDLLNKTSARNRTFSRAKRRANAWIEKVRGLIS